MGMNNTRFGVTTNHQEILRCDWSPMSTGFIILIKTCIKTDLVLEMDLGIWLCMGKVLGTPRHPSVDGYLPPYALVCV